MPPETIDVDAERGIIAQLFGNERPKTRAILYAELRITPDRVDQAVEQLTELHIVEPAEGGLRLTATVQRLDRLDLLHL
jgi:hypothetical protein